ncbi:BspA family leucine-rich repeat surface protein [Bifidobacterium sp. ESL0682]|uniref:BspA family leucine-rich repeat surface protein n=1 Tax=Bifidobacterium sp. ESL0682 TaxID=2983212 RepID=UPI0023F79E6A|nr:BspA family leucine-rich repeat surface protein [Bifidobacterium sp. ESL0682]WEV42755.1 BspA family leucine-rich repeat surface protein [Bifidobacterium sp. ESL0682]
MAALTTLDSGRHTVSLSRWAGNSLFDSDQSLTSLDLSHWDVSHNTSMNYMFSRCTNLKTLTGVAGLQTDNVTDMSGMFQYSRNLTDLDLSGWDTHNVTSLYGTFDGCDKLADLDLSGWDTRNVPAGFFSDSYMLPGNLKRLTLGAHTTLPNAANTSTASMGPGDAFYRLDPASHWHEWDWPKGHHPTDNGPVGPTPLTAGDGTLATLRARAASATPQGVYIRDDVTPTWTDLTYNLTGGAGDNSLPAQIGQAASGSTPKRDGLAIDTTFRDGSYTIPDDPDTGRATDHITANKAHSLFNGWSFDTSGVTGGTPSVSNHTLTAPKGATGTATVKAAWNTADEAAPGTPQVATDTHTADQGTTAVGATATLGTALPALTAVPASANGIGRPARPAVDAGGTMTVCVKPATQTGPYTSGQCHTKTSSTGGSQTLTPDAFTLPGSLTAGQDTTFPGPGEAYTMTASHTATDPVTRNTVSSDTTTAGGGLVTGTLPWVHASFDVNSAHGGTGTAPGELKSLVDTGSGRAWIQLPYATGSMTPAHAAFAGWSASNEAQQPDQGMNDPANRDVRLAATPGATETGATLHAVWHAVHAPAITGATRSPADNAAVIDGTGTPWDGHETIRLALTGLDGQSNTATTFLWDTNIDPDDAQGSPLPYDGATPHGWHQTFTARQLPQGGRYTVSAHATADDTAWHAGTTRTATSEDTATTLTIPGQYQHQLP